jgi:hypothetical protein
MGSILQDVRFGLRRLRRSPGFAATALLTLGLGIGATTAIFTLTCQVLLRSMPVERPEQLYKVGKKIDCCVEGGLLGNWYIFSYNLYLHLRDQTPGTDGMAATQAEYPLAGHVETGRASFSDSAMGGLVTLKG